MCALSVHYKGLAVLVFYDMDMDTMFPQVSMLAYNVDGFVKTRHTSCGEEHILVRWAQSMAWQDSWVPAILLKEHMPRTFDMLYSEMTFLTQLIADQRQNAETLKKEGPLPVAGCC
jgi:hypothetical protein